MKFIPYFSEDDDGSRSCYSGVHVLSEGYPRHEGIQE
jgi:hypothetical protein